MDEASVPPSEFYTGLVAQLYGSLRSSPPDPAPYLRFVKRFGEPALELGCGPGDPLLDLIADGFTVHGLDSSSDMLDLCRVEAARRGLEVQLHLATFEAMDLGMTFQSIYFAGPTFNLLPDDAAASRALKRIAAHLRPGGSALIPLFIPTPDVLGSIGRRTEHTDGDGNVQSVTVVSIDRDDLTRRQTIVLRYEVAGSSRSEVVERDWLLHWIERDPFSQLAAEAGLTVGGIYGDESAFSFRLDKPVFDGLREGEDGEKRDE